MTNYWIYYGVMNEQVNVYEAKARFSHWVDEVEAGRQVVICRRNRPVALLTPILRATRQARKLGLAKGTFEVDAAFFDPLPESELAAFEGR